MGRGSSGMSTTTACGLLSPKEKNQVQLICHERRIVGGVIAFFPRHPGFSAQSAFSLHLHESSCCSSQLRAAFLGPSTRCLDARLLTASSLFRELQDGDLKKFCSRVSKLLQEDLGPDAADALRRLFLIVSATKYNRK